jgi:hypothetical protein
MEKKKLYYVNTGFVSYPVDSFKQWLKDTVNYWLEWIKILGILILVLTIIMGLVYALMNALPFLK